MPPPFRVLIVLMFFLIAGCEITGPDDPRIGRDPDYQEQWDKFQGGTYYFTVVRGCFCVNGGEHWVQVKNGSVTSAYNIWRDEPVLEQDLQWIESMEDIFDMIQSAQTEAFSVQAEYSEWGYPTSVSIDWIEFAVDDEISLTISDVHPGIR